MFSISHPRSHQTSATALIQTPHTNEWIDGEGDVGNAGLAKRELWAWNGNNVARTKLLITAFQHNLHLLDSEQGTGKEQKGVVGGLREAMCAQSGKYKHIDQKVDRSRRKATRAYSIEKKKSTRCLFAPTCSSFWSLRVFSRLNCRTTWSDNTCFTHFTTYSVSDSVRATEVNGISEGRQQRGDKDRFSLDQRNAGAEEESQGNGRAPTCKVADVVRCIEQACELSHFRP